VLIAAAPGTAQAKLLLGNSLTWSTELTVGNEWAVSGTSLTWVITNPSTGIWHYKYIWDVGTGGTGDPSHFLLEVTNPARAGEFFNVTNAALSGGDPRTYQALSGPNFEMPYDLYRIKFTAPGGGSWGLSVTFSFDSTHSPTWDDFYARDGGNQNTGEGRYAYNIGFGADGVGAPNDGFHVAVPNGIVPIPSAAWLLGTGLIGLVVIRRRIKK
jgi:hypothetical protein